MECSRDNCGLAIIQGHGNQFHECSILSLSLFSLRKPYRVVSMLLFSLALLSAVDLQGAYIKRYSTIANGGMTFTGNTLGLSKRTNSNRPGSNGSIGTFITTDSNSQDGSRWYDGTTSDWTENDASAQLSIPSGSSVLYAELIWGGSYDYVDQDVSDELNTSVSFATPGGSYSVSPTASTSSTLTGQNYYVRSADVTSRVRAAGSGTYTVGGVPGTEGSYEQNSNAAGWTLAVIYENAGLAARNLTLFVGAELTSSSVQTTSSISGFCTPSAGDIEARMMVSAIEGDSNLTGDQMQFGPSVTSLSAVSGPNNPVNNFFASQINGADGNLDTAGTFGSRNHSPGSNSTGRRQGWDITNVDVSDQMVNAQNTAVAKGTTSGDRYVINAIGLQINVGAPVFPEAVMSVDKPVTSVGETLVYTTRLDNSDGSADALNVVFTDDIPNGLSFISGSVTVDGVTQATDDPENGIRIESVGAGETIVVSYQVSVDYIPQAPQAAEYVNNASWTYQYESCPDLPLNNGTVTTAPYVETLIARISPEKSASPAGSVLSGGTVTYTITVPNTGTAATSGTTLQDPIPDGTTYVPNSTTLNGTSIADSAGQMPYVAAPVLINSPGDSAGTIALGDEATVSFQVTIDEDPPLIITNTATIDVDGEGGNPAQTAVVTNPPVQADLGVDIDDGQATGTAGAPLSYTVTVTNNGPDTVISFLLDVALPAKLQDSVFTPDQGIYNTSTQKWTGINLADGQSVALTISGTVDPAALDSLTATATVFPSAGVEDKNADNDSASDTDTLLRIADLSIAKTDDQPAVKPGNNISYAITVTNAGPSTVTSVTVVDALPNVLQNVVFAPEQGVYNEQTGLWTGLSLPPSASVVLTLTATVDVSTSDNVVNTVTVAPPDGVTDPDESNNTATDTNVIGPIIKLTKATDKPSATPGDEVIYSVHFHNVGGSSAQTLIIMDSIPEFTTYVAGSLRLGGADSSYAAATPKTDAADSDEGSVALDTVRFTIDSIDPDDGADGSGDDEGNVFFKVKID
jgi:uncharacterized repeat protein (TIGR01451 family)